MLTSKRLAGASEGDKRAGGWVGAQTRRSFKVAEHSHWKLQTGSLHPSHMASQQLSVVWKLQTGSLHLSNTTCCCNSAYDDVTFPAMLTSPLCCSKGPVPGSSFQQAKREP
eukprot:216302-Pelagomonas_calceolata.AAC.2